MAMDGYSDYVGDQVAGASASEVAAADAEYREWLADEDEHGQHPDGCGCPVDDMSASVTAGDLRIGDRIVAVNGHPPPGGEPVEVIDAEWGLVNNVLRVTLRHNGRDVHQQLHVDEPVEVQR